MAGFEFRIEQIKYDVGHCRDRLDHPSLYLQALYPGQRLPADMLADLTPDGRALGERKAGMLPYITLLAGVLTVAIAYVIFWT
jgi:hypothetical protein